MSIATAIFFTLRRYRCCSSIIGMDWKKLIGDIIASGLTQAEIAKRCQTGQSYISELSRGVRTQPSWVIGERLRTLHRGRAKRQIKDAA